MQLTIFLDKDAKFLNLMIPASSPAAEAIARAFHTRDYWAAESRDVIIDCDDTEAMELLAYAQSYCPSAGAKIRRLPLSSPTSGRNGPCSATQRCR